MENKTGKYFKYAIGEIILVVIGILIALQINNWNENRKTNQELYRYLSSIRTNIENDRVVLDSLKVKRKIIVESCKKERLTFFNKTFDLQTTRNGLRAYSDFYFAANNSGYEALKNSTYLGKINGSTLNSLLSDYYAQVTIISQEEKSFNEFLESLETSLAFIQDRTVFQAYYFMDPKEFADTKVTEQDIIDAFQNVHQSIAYRNIISEAIFQEDNIIVPYDKLKEIGVRIIEEINQITPVQNKLELKK